MTIRLLTAVAVCLAGLGLVAAEAADKKPIQRDLSKDYDELTPSEHIAIRAAAKAAYKAKKLKVLNVCADPGNMPLSNMKGEGFQNKIASLLASSMGARLEYHWIPFIERGLTRATFDQSLCDVMLDVPMNYGRLLTTFPVYKTPYVLVFRNDKGLNITGLDDPKLKDLKIGVFQTSGIRMALARRGIVDNLKLQTQTHDADLVVENQPWYVVQRMLNGEFDVAAVFGPFAGWVKTMKGEPITILPVNMMDDQVPLEFELGIGVRRTDAFLKYMIEFALEDHEKDIEKILKDYGVPLVQCSKCIVPGDLPAHGTYTQVAQTEYKARPDLASPDQVVTKEKLEGWLSEGADLTQELSNAIVANDQDRVKFLVEKGADINKPDNQGGTPLTNAARQRQDKMVELLIKLGADVNEANTDGMTPLTTAVMRDTCADGQSPARQRCRRRGAGPGRIPSACRRHRRRQIRSGQSPDGGRRRRKRAGRCRRADATDGRRRAERPGRGRDVPAVEHAAARDRQRAYRARRRCKCKVEIRHHRSDGCGDA